MASVANATMVGSLYQLAGTDLIADPKLRGGLYSTRDANGEILNSIFIGAPVGAQSF